MSRYRVSDRLDSRSASTRCVTSRILRTSPPMSGSSKQLVATCSTQRQVPAAFRVRYVMTADVPGTALTCRVCRRTSSRSSTWMASKSGNSSTSPNPRTSASLDDGDTCQTCPWRSTTSEMSCAFEANARTRRSRFRGSSSASRPRLGSHPVAGKTFHPCSSHRFRSPIVSRPPR